MPLQKRSQYEFMHFKQLYEGAAAFYIINVAFKKLTKAEYYKKQNLKQ